MKTPERILPKPHPRARLASAALALFAAAGLAACGGNEEPLISETPEIELLETAPLEARAYKDSITFRLRYEDGDGDLGENAPDAYNLFLSDPRADLSYRYRIPEIVPGGAEAPVRGTFTFSLKNTILTDSVPEQSVRFQIYVVDRAGRQSNVVESPPVTVRE